MHKENTANYLEEKFRNEFSWIEKAYPIDLYREAQQCAQICEEVAVEFAEWVSINCYPTSISGEFIYVDKYGTFRKTTKELFTLFLTSKQTEHGS